MMTTQYKGQRPSGFTLVEALLVVTIVGIVLPVALYCINNCQRTASVVKQRAQALEIATNQMNIAVATQTWQNDQQGDQTTNNGVFHWQTHAQTWSYDTTDSSLHELHVDVTWPDGARQRSVSLVTLVYDGGINQ